MKRFFLSFVVVLFVQQQSLAQLTINELLASNSSGIQDEAGQFEDWFEIYNAGGSEVDISGMYVSDDATNLTLYRFPTGNAIASGEFAQFWADGDLADGPRHVDVKLGGSGETLYLVDTDGTTIIDEVTFGPLGENISYGRNTDGAGIFVPYNIPSPGGANGTPPGCILTLSTALVSPITAVGAADGQATITALNAAYPLTILWKDASGTTADPMALSAGTYNVDVTDKSGCVKSASITVSDPTGGAAISNVFINEWMADNVADLTDNDGGLAEQDDWIEIYNANDFSVDLGGLYIWDALGEPLSSMHLIPTGSPATTTVPAGGYLILWADKQPEQGPLHVNFALGKGGESIGLYQIFNGAITAVDEVSFPAQSPDISYGRFPDGTNNFQPLINTTPGATNSSGGSNGVTNVFVNEIMSSNSSTFATTAGLFEDWIEIYNGNSTAVDLGGFFITDDIGLLTKYQIPSDNSAATTVPANGYLILWADGDPALGADHLDIKLGAAGDDIALVEPNGSNIVDSFTFGRITADVSYGRATDGASALHPFQIPTPNASNNSSAKTCIITVTAGVKSTITSVGGTDGVLEFSIANGSYPFTTAWIDANGSTADPLAVGAGTYTIQVTDAANCTISETVTISDPTVQNAITGVYINEVMAANASYYGDTDFADPDNPEFDDWIEIYNSNSTAVNLGGLYIWDQGGQDVATMYKIPETNPLKTTVPAGGYLILWADKEIDQGENHVDFSLSAAGESVVLYQIQADGLTLLDSITFGTSIDDESFGRLPDGTGAIQVLEAANPGTTNTNKAPFFSIFPGTISFLEDTPPSSSVALTAVDPENSTVIYSVRSDNADLGVSVDNLGFLGFDPTADYFGTGTITVVASDGSALSKQTVGVEVQRVNDVPVFSLSPAQLTVSNEVSKTETVSVVVAAPVLGEGGETITYTIAPNSGSINDLANVSINANTGVISFEVPAAGAVGSQSFTVTATDDGLDANNEISPATYEESFTLVVEMITSVELENFSNSISLLPNPTTGLLTFEVNNAYRGNFEIKAFDVNGKSLGLEQISKGENFLSKTLNLTDLEAGLIIIQLKQGELVVHRRVIKQ